MVSPIGIVEIRLGLLGERLPADVACTICTFHGIARGRLVFPHHKIRISTISAGGPTVAERLTAMHSHILLGTAAPHDSTRG